jgi:hypothetical protein
MNQQYNCFLACSNLFALPAISSQMAGGFFIDMILTTLVAAFSFWYHLFENRYGLLGIQRVPNELSLYPYKIKLADDVANILFNIEKVLIPMLFLYISYYRWAKLIGHPFYILFAVSCGMAGELFGREKMVHDYFIFHLFWHFSCYHILSLLY